MNRRQRRAQKKAGGSPPRRPALPAPIMRRSISEMLLGLGGIDEMAPAAAPARLETDGVVSALAQIRLDRSATVELDRLQRALAAQPDSADLLHRVARLQIRLDRRADALVTFRRLLALQPDHPEARHMAAVLAGEAPARAHAAYIADLFDRFADSFDDKLVGWLDYRGPQQVAALAAAALGGLPASRAVDLGCGTGLAGVEVRPLVRRLDGIDLSPRMVAHARERRIYDDLHIGEIVAALYARPETYDLMVAADVLSYFGDLRPVFEAAHRALRGPGLFVATVEAGSDAGRYAAARTGRYQHGGDYLRRRAAEAGFELQRLDDIDLRLEQGRPVAGYAFVLRRLPPAAPDPLAMLSTGELLAGLDRAGADILLAGARRMVGEDFAVGWAIDLGGGMASQAETLRRLAQHVDMVDPDPERCRRAFESGAYDECESGDPVAYLEARPDHYDLILATDLLRQAADPAAAFSAVKIALAVAGVFVALAPAGPYDADDWRRMAQAEGLFVLAVEPVTLPDGAAAFCLAAES
jgi:predicted TPR repeat methyltransferase